MLILRLGLLMVKLRISHLVKCAVDVISFFSKYIILDITAFKGISNRKCHEYFFFFKYQLEAP
jgi:hypothetical protein